MTQPVLQRSLGLRQPSLGRKMSAEGVPFKHLHAKIPAELYERMNNILKAKKAKGEGLTKIDVVEALIREWVEQNEEE